MDEVQRYRWFAPSEAVGEEPARDGEWVRYTDHARRVSGLEAKVATYRAALSAAEHDMYAHRQKALAAEADAGRLRADAMRYRWLRETGSADEITDERIDAALAAGVGGGSDG